MSARTKLNVAAVHGAILVAALIGWATGSWILFLLAVVVLIGTAVHAGDIRPNKRR